MGIFRKPAAVPPAPLRPNFETSMKKSIRRSFWQIKSGPFEHYSLHGFQFLLDELVEALGFDKEDREAVYIVTFGVHEIEDYHLKLRKGREGGEVVDFSVVENRLGQNRDPGFLPSQMFLKMDYAFDTLYLRIRKSEQAVLWFLRELEGA